MTDGFSAVIGRNFLADQEERQYDSANPANAGNDNFGNVVGLATAGNGRLYVFSSEQRGFEQEDPTFFWALTVGADFTCLRAGISPFCEAMEELFPASQRRCLCSPNQATPWSG